MMKAHNVRRQPFTNATLKGRSNLPRALEFECRLTWRSGIKTEKHGQFARCILCARNSRDPGVAVVCKVSSTWPSPSQLSQVFQRQRAFRRLFWTWQEINKHGPCHWNINQNIKHKSFQIMRFRQSNPLVSMSSHSVTSASGHTIPGSPKSDRNDSCHNRRYWGPGKRCVQYSVLPQVRFQNCIARTKYQFTFSFFSLILLRNLNKPQRNISHESWGHHRMFRPTTAQSHKALPAQVFSLTWMQTACTQTRPSLCGVSLLQPLIWSACWDDGILQPEGAIQRSCFWITKSNLLIQANYSENRIA